MSATHELPLRRLGEHLRLDRRDAVGKEDESGVLERLGHDRVELAEHVKLNVEGLSVVHVLEVATGPAEGLAIVLPHEPGRIDTAALEPLGVLLWEVATNHPDEANRGEVARGVRKVRRRSTQ